MVIRAERLTDTFYKTRLAGPKLSPERNDISPLKVLGERLCQLKSFLF